MAPRPAASCLSADFAESVVVEAVQQLLAGVTGTATTDTGIAQARGEVERLEAELEAAVRAFTGLDDVDAVRDRLTELRQQRDEARDRLDDLAATVLPAITVTARDWETLTLAEQRDLVRAVIDRAVVSPGRSRDRITVEPRT
jgi:hypothetical protein